MTEYMLVFFLSKYYKLHRIISHYNKSN